MDYWWSNSYPDGESSHVHLDTLKTGDKMLTNTFTANRWSDYDGHFADSDAAHLVAFDAALHNVKAIGLSLGGGCFFENGVGIKPGTGSGYFRLMDFGTSPASAGDPLAQLVPELVLAPFVTPTLISLP
jgi:hypothetical protein